MFNSPMFENERAAAPILRPQVPPTPQPVQRFVPPPATASFTPRVPQHNQPLNIAASIALVLFFLCLSIGVVAFTTAADRAEKKNRPHEPARNLPIYPAR
jgi:hypothetical protein